MASAALLPSPAALTTCFVLPSRTSPAAKTPGTLVSIKAETRDEACGSAISLCCKACPVTIKPQRSNTTMVIAMLMDAGYFLGLEQLHTEPLCLLAQALGKIAP